MVIRPMDGPKMVVDRMGVEEEIVVGFHGEEEEAAEENMMVDCISNEKEDMEKEVEEEVHFPHQMNWRKMNYHVHSS